MLPIRRVDKVTLDSSPAVYVVAYLSTKQAAVVWCEESCGVRRVVVWGELCACSLSRVLLLTEWSTLLVFKENWTWSCQSWWWHVLLQKMLMKPLGSPEDDVSYERAPSISNNWPSTSVHFDSLLKHVCLVSHLLERRIWSFNVDDDLFHQINHVIRVRFQNSSRKKRHKWQQHIWR